MTCPPVTAYTNIVDILQPYDIALLVRGLPTTFLRDRLSRCYATAKVLSSRIISALVEVAFVVAARRNDFRAPSQARRSVVKAVARQTSRSTRTRPCRAVHTRVVIATKHASSMVSGSGCGCAPRNAILRRATSERRDSRKTRSVERDRKCAAE